MKKINSLEMVDISKAFQGIFANKNLNLSINAGEILGLLGENGAGKTTLMNILYGLYQPDSGRIMINGQPVKISSPVDSISKGIGMVHQHFMLIQNHSVIENIALAYKDTPFFFPKKAIREKVVRFASRFNFKIAPSKKIWQLSAGEQQRVEIIKALLNGADLLILDEPTSVLTSQEISELFAILRDMKKNGHMVIFISHKLDEVMAVCDRVTVLRKGEIVGNAETAGTDKTALARMMIGQDMMFGTRKNKIPPGPKVLGVDNITVRDDKGFTAVKGITFEVYRNEIFGVAGVAGNGQKELAEAITGIRPVVSGKIDVNGRNVTNTSPRTLYDAGVSHVPEERIRFGIAPGLFVYDNAILKQHHLKQYAGQLFLRYSRIKNHAGQLVDNFNVFTPSLNAETRNLSGGNIQKLIFGREMTGNPDLLVASHPTYGLDVGATQYLREKLLERRASGGAVLLFSEDLDEIFELCDRVAVIFEGEFAGIFEPDDCQLADIGLMMAGSVKHA